MNGRIVDGEGNAGRFVASVTTRLRDAIGFRPYAGTLNLTGIDSLDILPSERHPLPGDDHCEGLIVRPCRVSGIRAAVLRPLVPEYPDEKTEILAPVELRELFSVTDGDSVQLTPADDCTQTATVAGQAMDRFDAVVLDLDGTLLDLQVEWNEVHSQLKELLGPHLDAPLQSHSRAEVFEIAREHDSYGELDEIVEDAEVEGAYSARSRAALGLPEKLDCPVAVCTANAERAARIALETFDAFRYVDTLIARDTIPEDKPHPRTLLACLDALDAKPGNALYVGDEAVDEELAVNVGASYADPDHVSLF